MNFEDYVKHDATGLAALVRDKEISASDLLETAIARTEQVDPQLNAVVIKHYELARDTVSRGLPQGPLAGVPFLLKDLFIDLEGTTTSSGCVFLKNSVAKADSTVATRYKKAGLVIFGKTHGPELGGGPTTESRLWGVTRNPWDLSRTPGGSSGGSAAAVVAGIVPAANGSDAGGSIRTPASLTGLFGHKPTRGLVPLGPSRFDGGGGIATLHALTRTVRDSAVLLDVVAGPEPGALYGSPVLKGSVVSAAQKDPGKLRIALNMRSTSGGVTDEDCAEAARDAARKCEALGHHVTIADPDLDLDLYLRTRQVLRGATLAGAVRGIEKSLGRKAVDGDFEPATWKAAQEGLTLRGDEVLAARESMFTLHKQMVAFMSQFDVVVSPTLQTLSPRPGSIDMQQTSEAAMDEIGRYAAFSMIYNLTGQPSMSVPLYWNVQGMPVGTQFTGRFGDDELLFSLAGQLERAYPWFDRLPAFPFKDFSQAGAIR